MIYSSLIIAALLQTSAFAADQREMQHVRRTAVEDHEQPNVPHKHQPRGEKSSSMVTYFTMGGKEEKKKKKKKSHDGKSGAKEARIVGGSLLAAVGSIEAHEYRVEYAGVQERAEKVPVAEEKHARGYHPAEQRAADHHHPNNLRHAHPEARCVVDSNWFDDYDWYCEE